MNRNCGILMVAVLLTRLVPCTTAAATEYQMTVLAPSPFSGGEAYGVYHGQVVGAGFHGAVMWPTPTTYVDLNPTGYVSSTAFAIYGNQEVGMAISNADHQQHPVIWTGTASSLVDLTAGGGIGYATGTDGSQQVGVVSGTFGGFAALWSGTASSFVDLNPAGYQQSYAMGVYGGIQVGYGSAPTGGTQALVWHGTPESFTVLGPGQLAIGPLSVVLGPLPPAHA